MLLELARPVTLLASMISLLAVFHTAFLGSETSFQQRLYDSLGVLLPGKMSKDDQTEYDKLSGLSGKAFDTEYLTYVLKAHWTKRQGSSPGH